MSIGYIGTTFQDWPSTSTLITAARLNTINEGVVNAHEALADHESRIDDLESESITNEKILATKADFLANETAGKVVDATVLKPIIEASIQIVSFNATTGALVTKSMDYVG